MVSPYEEMKYSKSVGLECYVTVSFLTLHRKKKSNMENIYVKIYIATFIQNFQVKICRTPFKIYF